MASFSETRGVAVSTERVSQPVVPDGVVEISVATFADMLLQGQISIATFADMLVQGQLHFRTPHNQKTVTDTTRLRVVLDGDVAFIQGCVYDFFDGTTPSGNPFERVRFAERDVEPANSSVSQPGVTDVLATSAWIWTAQPPAKHISEDAMSVNTGVSQPSVETRPTQPLKNFKKMAKNALMHGVAEALLKEVREWYENRQDDEDVTNAWKHLHKLLYKKVRVRPSGFICDNEDDTEQGVEMVVSAEDVALQVKNIIERREQFLETNNLPLDTIMMEEQKTAFLKEVEEEYHNSDYQRSLQQQDSAEGKIVAEEKKNRWSRECEHRGGTMQMWQLLSFAGRWDPSFFENEPVPQLQKRRPRIRK